MKVQEEGKSNRESLNSLNLRNGGVALYLEKISTGKNC